MTYCVILSSYHPDWARPERTHTEGAAGRWSNVNNNNRLLATIEAAAKKERGEIYICTRPLEHFETLSGVGKSKKKEKTNEIKTRKKKVIT